MVRLVKQWRFKPGWEGQFEITARFAVDTRLWTCVAMRNPTISVRVPTDIQITVPQFRFCDGTQAVVETGIVTGTLDGVLRCDCTNRRTISDAIIRVTPEPAQAFDEERRRLTKTARDGSFQVAGLPDGKYQVEISAQGFESKAFLFRIDNGRTGRQVIEWLVAEEPAVELNPVTVVKEADIPLYPRAAAERGIEGVVTLRVSGPPDRELSVQIESGPPMLARAAAENVRSWVFESPPASKLKITFAYKLLPGDCGLDQQPVVTMRFPTAVELTAKRVVKCRI
jgi:hypothetical protein